MINNRLQGSTILHTFQDDIFLAQQCWSIPCMSFLPAPCSDPNSKLEIGSLLSRSSPLVEAFCRPPRFQSAQSARPCLEARPGLSSCFLAFVAPRSSFVASGLLGRDWLPSDRFAPQWRLPFEEHIWADLIFSYIHYISYYCVWGWITFQQTLYLGNSTHWLPLLYLWRRTIHGAPKDTSRPWPWQNCMSGQICTLAMLNCHSLTHFQNRGL